MSIDTNKIYEFVGIPSQKRYYNLDNAYGVYVVNTKEELPESRISTFYNDETKTIETGNQIILVGKMQELGIDQKYKFQAKLLWSKKYNNWQYDVVSVQQDLPTSAKDQSLFLRTILTENQVETLLSVYPNIVQEVIDGKEEIDYSLTKGIKEYTWNLIKHKILDNFAIADLLTLLSPLGISLKKIRKLLDDEPNANIIKQRILEDPYLIVDVPGIGFKQADKIALKLNPDLLVSNKRTLAFVKYYLKEIGETDGHTWVTFEELLLAVKENIIECVEVFQSVIDNENQEEKFLHIENEKIGLRYYYQVEKNIWNIINKVKNYPCLTVDEQTINYGIEKSEKMQGFKFTEEQKEILKKATECNLTVITGKAGTGKTTIARGLLNIYSNLSIGACALSAKAAKRLTEVSGYEATTIHRMLSATGPNQFEYDGISKWLPYDVVFIDESSMIFSGLFYSVLKAMKNGTKLIICGDNAQLPPIGYGNPFSDILNREDIEVFKLTKILRQAEQSGIISHANQIRNGIDPLDGIKPFKEQYGELQDLYYMFRASNEDLNDIAIKTYLKTIQNPEIGVENCYLLTSRKDGVLNSSRKINERIQDILFDEETSFIKYGDYKKFKLGARVIHIVNDYDKKVFNGDMGYVSDIGVNSDGDEYLEVKYPDKSVIYSKTDLSDLELGYCLTVHKAQGSEAHTVIVIIDNGGYMLLDNTLLYTSLTRAKSRCLLLSQPFAFDRCIQTNKSNNRNTWTKYF